MLTYLTGPFTVLAPTNGALHTLDADVLTAFTREASLVKQVVQYHIIPDFAVLPELSSAQEVQSLEGQPIKFSGSVTVSKRTVTSWDKVAGVKKNPPKHENLFFFYLRFNCYSTTGPNHLKCFLLAVKFLVFVSNSVLRIWSRIKQILNKIQHTTKILTFTCTSMCQISV